MNANPLASPEMLEITRDSLVMSFPDVHARAMLRVGFRKADAPKEAVEFAGQRDGGFVLGTQGATRSAPPSASPGRC